MSKWKKIKGINLDDLRKTRKSLHLAVQTVSLLPRHLLSHDPTDGTASLEWNKPKKALESISVVNEVGLSVRVGLSLKKFELYIGNTGTTIASFDMNGKSVLQSFEWLKIELDKLVFDSGKLTLNLPYQLEEFDTSQLLAANKNGLKEYSRLFGNTHAVLSQLMPMWKDAFDIRCWPHHFDIATLIPVKKDSQGEILQSIGVGLSPGDEGIDEPYLYVNVWPQMEFESLSKHSLPGGHWNKSGWSGAVFTYSELVEIPDQEKSFEKFIQTAIAVIKKELD